MTGLNDRSKKPEKSPRMMKMYWQFKIKSIAEKAQADNKRINGAMIKQEYSIPYSGKTIVKYLKQYYKLPSKKTHREKKRDMREIKSKYRAFEKIQVDIKYLDDIPEFYDDFMRFHLPKYQITARCIRTGALFIGYTQQHSTTATSIFIYRLLTHLKHYGVKPAEVTIQTDNGTEFTAPWNSLKKTLFTKIIELSFRSTHKTIPVGAKTYQSDVESSHRLIEDEFYACRYFSGTQDFLNKAHHYQTYFNFKRFNTYKKGSPVQLLQQAACYLNPAVLNFKPVLVDKFFNLYKDEFRLLAS
ncbi:hypothetical protein TPE_2264 [Treponema pedis str. T A4]|uniref:Integrase catalytic domain-containing protein n=2 Tax=Treponema pedis TaxID=409322 RepID=S6A1J6_9SPIR|nr:hypothetical protein TPE_2264 [Treponema pedis str. T A4]